MDTNTRQILFICSPSKTLHAFGEAFKASLPEPISAFTLQDAGTILAQAPLALVICASQLLDGSYRDVLRILARERRRIPVMVVSLTSREEECKEAKRLGAMDCVPRPLTPEDVQIVVEKALEVIAQRPGAYAIDPAGYRVSSVDEPVDPERPTILFTGESVMFGGGLTYAESIPAQVGAMMGIQTANLAAHGYGNDQAYLRLETELPHFRRPVGVVSLFMTALFGRNLDQDRPHLGLGLVWLPAEQRSRLSSLAKLLVPYRADTTVERGVRVTQEVLRATSELARAHAATPLLVVLQFGHEEGPEQVLRRRILDDASIPYVLVDIDSSWRLPWDRHPSARAAHAIAAPIVTQLRRRLAVAAPLRERKGRDERSWANSSN
jgi:CheY-like chemotaxis protein